MTPDNRYECKACSAPLVSDEEVALDMCVQCQHELWKAEYYKPKPFDFMTDLAEARRMLGGKSHG